MNQLRIDNPCPTLISRLDRDGNDFSCKSCNKKVIDFRNKTPEEIKTILTKDMCGVFNNTQLTGQVKMTRTRQFLFYGLTILSFLGFNVSPLNAKVPSQNDKTSFSNYTDEIPESISLNYDDDEKSKKK